MAHKFTFYAWYYSRPKYRTITISTTNPSRSNAYDRAKKMALKMSNDLDYIELR